MYAQERRGYSCPRLPRQSSRSRYPSQMTAPPTAVPVHEITADREDDAERALEVLLDSALDPIVDMVLLARDAAYEARSHDGWVRFRRTEGGGYEKIASEGADPLANQSPNRFAGLEAERAHPC